jgi:hypothetical protein
MYLSDVEKGGETIFPRIGLEVPPKKVSFKRRERESIQLEREENMFVFSVYMCRNKMRMRKHELKAENG